MPSHTAILPSIGLLLGAIWEMSANASINVRLIYRGGPPVYWTGGPSLFGLQDQDNGLLGGRADADGAVTFDFTVGVKTGKAGEPVLLGAFTHGPPAKRFAYIAWRNANGAYAERLKVPLTSITWNQI